MRFRAFACVALSVSAVCAVDGRAQTTRPGTLPAVVVTTLPTTPATPQPTTRVYSRAERLAAVRTPAVSVVPRINGPEVYGARPARPFAYYLPVTGENPQITVEGLPDGLTFDPATRMITGTSPARGEYLLNIRAANAHGKTERALRLAIGDAIALTPPLGWNTYNAFRMRIDDKLLRAQADAMVATGLINHGWTYLNIDDGWQGDRDANGVIRGNTRFPDMKALGIYIHSKGLKYGLYSSPGPKTCAGYEGSYAHEDLDARTYADWGVDFIKYDWCYYEGVAQRFAAEAYAALLPQHAERIRAIVNERVPLQEDRTRPRPVAQSDRIRALTLELNTLLGNLPPGKQKEIEMELYVRPYRQFGESLAKVDRDIVYSLCQYGMGLSAEWASSVGGNLWRTTRDITPRWTAITNIIRQQDGLEKYARPGAWNDPDMLEIGNGQLSPDEMHMQMTQWCILAAPLLMGSDLTKLDELTLSIFRNDEVIAVNQDQLGRQGWKLSGKGPGEVYIKPLSGGRMAVALFNRGEEQMLVSASFEQMSLSGPMRVRDTWRQLDLANERDTVAMDVAPHGAELLVLTPVGN